MTEGPASASEAPEHDERPRPSIAERAAKRDQMAAGGRDRYSALLRSLQAGHEIPIYRRGGRLAIDWHPVLWTLVKIAVVVVAAYFLVRAGTQWWRENHVDTWSGPDASVQSGVRLPDCPLVDAIRIDDFPSWVAYGGSLYRYTGWKRPYTGPQTPGYAETGYTSGSMNLITIENTPDGVARDTVLVWLDDALAGIEYARTPDCSPPSGAGS